MGEREGREIERWREKGERKRREMKLGEGGNHGALDTVAPLSSLGGWRSERGKVRQLRAVFLTFSPNPGSVASLPPPLGESDRPCATQVFPVRGVSTGPRPPCWLLHPGNITHVCMCAHACACVRVRACEGVRYVCVWMCCSTISLSRCQCRCWCCADVHRADVDTDMTPYPELHDAPLLDVNCALCYTTFVGASSGGRSPVVARVTGYRMWDGGS